MSHRQWLHMVHALRPSQRLRLRARHRRRLRLHHGRQLAPARVAERADEVAVRDAGGDAVEVEGVGALGREDGLPAGGAHGGEAYRARIALHPSKSYRKLSFKKNLFIYLESKNNRMSNI